MTSYLIDINVWLALTWEGHSHASIVNAWFSSIPQNKTRLLFCRITQLGLIRLLTNKKVMGESVVSIATAFKAYDRWVEDPRVEFLEETSGVDLSFRHALARVSSQNATKAVMDAYLIGFASAESAILVTLDRGLNSAAKAARSACTLLRPT